MAASTAEYRVFAPCPCWQAAAQGVTVAYSSSVGQAVSFFDFCERRASNFCQFSKLSACCPLKGSFSVLLQHS
jgi:hypothetical protein